MEMQFDINQVVFSLALAVNLFLLAMMYGSEKSKRFQFWPPPSSNSWQYYALWWSIRIIVVCIIWLIYREHSTLGMPDNLRFYVAAPIFMASFLLGTIAAFQLGWRNTHGEAEKFVQNGFYRFSRNPQYVIYSISFLSLSVCADSLKALILLVLLSVWYLRAPFPEEKWLTDQYGETYEYYKKRVPRYF